jgi:hypothetical protein
MTKELSITIRVSQHLQGAVKGERLNVQKKFFLQAINHSNQRKKESRYIKN